MEKLFTIYEGTEDEKSYTAEDFASMGVGERISLASDVIAEALEDMNPWEVVQFAREYEIVRHGQIGDGYDVFEADEAEYLVDWKHDAADFIGDVARAAMENRVTGTDWLHWDEDGDIWIEDEADIIARIGEDIPNFADALTDYVDREDLSFYISGVDVPEELQDRIDELADAYQTATGKEEA
jgi:hypothetical protein